jgi:2-alkenal reductase
MTALNNLEARRLGVATERGVLVTNIVVGGPSDKAGLRATTVSRQNGSIAQLGDVILAVNGRDVKDSDELISTLINIAKPGDTVTMTVLRDGKQLPVKVVVGERPR